MDSVSQLRAARAALGQGQGAEAEAACRQILAANPRDTDAMLLLAEIATRTGRGSLAQQMLRSAVTTKPDSVEALVRLARHLRTVRGQEEAIELCRRALAIAPDNADAHFVLGISCIDRWRVQEAIAALEGAIKYRPGYGPAYDRLGYALQLDGRNQDAIAAFRRAIELSPDVPNGYVNLGHLLIREGATEESESIFQAADRISANSAGHMLALARAHQAFGSSDRAETALRKAIRLAPTADGPRLLLTQILQESGRFEEAAGILKDALKQHPENSTLYHELVYGGKITKADRPLIEAMTRLVKRPSITPEDRIQLNYSLGKAFDDLGEYGNAISHFHEANRLARQLMPVTSQDRKAHSELIDVFISTYTPEYFEKYKGLGSESDEPVFIVGMPRSGTTLTEQIISSHPMIGAVGELTYLSTLAPIMADPKKPPQRDQILALAEGYLRRIRSTSNGEPRITDKMPNNFMLSGLIHLMLPNARIILCRRNPIDTCLSIYVTPITVDFSHSLPDIAFSQHEYERLMTHWRKVLPPNRWLEVDYEEIAANSEPVVRRILEFLELPWNDAVRKHEANSRAVNTASRWQVRQPLHTSSIERWRRYEPWIGELLQEFPDVIARP